MKTVNEKNDSVDRVVDSEGSGSEKPVKRTRTRKINIKIKLLVLVTDSPGLIVSQLSRLMSDNINSDRAAICRHKRLGLLSMVHESGHIYKYYISPLGQWLLDKALDLDPDCYTYLWSKPIQFVQVGDVPPGYTPGQVADLPWSGNKLPVPDREETETE